MSINNILNSGNSAPDWVNLRTYSLINDNTITSTDINVTGTLTAGTFSFTNLTIDDLTVNNTTTTNDLDVINNINCLNLVSSNDITGNNIIATNVINTPDIVVTGTAAVNDLSVNTFVNTDTLNATTSVTTTDLTATGTVTCQSSFTVFTDTANIHNSLNTCQAPNLNITSTATLPPITFIGSITNFSFNSVTFNVTFTMFTNLNVSQGTKNSIIRYTTIGNVYCLVLNIFTIIASGDYQYLSCPNPGIILPLDFCYCPIIALDNNINYNGFVTISPTGDIKIFKNSNQDNFGAITALIPYSTCFYSII